MWEMIAWYSADYDMDGLQAHLKHFFDVNERQMDPSRRLNRIFPNQEARGAGLTSTTSHKLRHDMEQCHYLAAQDDLFTAESQQLFATTLPARYQAVLDRILLLMEKDGDPIEHDPDHLYQFDERDVATGVTEIYNRALYLPDYGLDALLVVDNESGESRRMPILNPETDFAKLERQWFGEEQGDSDKDDDDHEGENHGHPGIVVVDNLLSEKALQAVREYLLSSTFWYETKTRKLGTYVGAYIDDGMYDKLLLALAFDLHKAMPRVMEGHPFKYMWSYKYDSALAAAEASSNASNSRGIHTHADDAAVNVNIWITPDEANLDPTSGGLVIFTVKPPDDWNVRHFNANWERIEEDLLKPTQYANVTVPYRQNRAVIFDSALFHKSDQFRFQTGYENRRINLTFLYGNRPITGVTSESSSSSASSKDKVKEEL
jgi:hypothetical protein